jgi:hypothetical protein
MAEWKKVIVSGSSPEFAAISVDGTVTANAFSGDGSGLTGVAAGSIDIDNFTAGTALDQGDHFLYSDGGTEKKVTFSNLEDAIFGNVSGDATIAAGGALTIGTGAVENTMLANATISIGGIEFALGDEDATPAFDLTDASGYRAGSLVGGLGASSLVGTTVISSSMSVTALSDVDSVGSGQIITSAERTKLDGIEANADVTDTTNVTAAGALMDSEVTDLDGIKSLTVPNNTTISAFGATLVDDANAAAARTTLGVDEAGTDNSTDVTLAGSRDYLTISGQEITVGQIDISDDTNLAVSDTSGQTGINLTLSGDTLSGVVSGLSTSDDVQFRNITATGDLTVQGALTSLQTTNLNIEDQFILLNSGSSDAAVQGIVFGGSTGTQGAGEAFFYDADTDRPAWSTAAVEWDATDATVGAFIPRVFDVDGSSHTPINEVGSIQVSGGEIYIYG